MCVCVATHSDHKRLLRDPDGTRVPGHGRIEISKIGRDEAANNGTRIYQGIR